MSDAVTLEEVRRVAELANLELTEEEEPVCSTTSTPFLATSLS